MNPTPVDLDNLLPRILGTAEVADVFDLADTIPSFFLVVDRDIKVASYTTMYVSRATFRGSEAGPMELTLEVMGISESVGASGSFPAISISDASVPYIFSELVLVVNSVTYSAKTWSLTVDNVLERQHFNSITPTRINATDRIITVEAQLPYGDASAAYGLSAAGVAVTATFTNGNRSCLFNTPAVAFPRRSPTVTNSRGEVFLNLSGIARKTSGSFALRVTNDSTG